ncbi:unnamed protein product [Closterium sp. NIES-54]
MFVFAPCSSLIPGLECPSEPHGGMFLMVRVDLARFPSFPDDISWCRQLLQEQRVVLIPGTAFRLPGWVRVVLSVPPHIMSEAWDRIAAFCVQHYKTA